MGKVHAKKGVVSAKDRVLKCYKPGMTLKELGEKMKINAQYAGKLLKTAGVDLLADQKAKRRKDIEDYNAKLRAKRVEEIGKVDLPDKPVEEMTEEEKRTAAEEIKRQMLALMGELDRRRTEEAIRYYKPNRAQTRFHYIKNDENEISRNRLAEGGNKFGKTACGSVEDIAHAFGYRPWLPKDHPDYKIDVKVPNNGLVLGETITNSVDKKLVPELLFWLPKKCQAEPRKNPQGVVVKIHIPYGLYGEKCKSTIHLGSYDQPSDAQEGVDWDWIHYDEPPPHNIYLAVERGKIAYNGRSWITMTPLKEPWVLDEIVEKAELDSNYGVTHGIIWDNLNGFHCDYCWWHEDRKKVENKIKEFNPEKISLEVIKGVFWDTTKIACPQCGKAAYDMKGVLTKDAILDFIGKLDPDELDAREKGKWKHLSGLVYSKFWKDEKHLIDDFEMSRCFRAGWTPYESVDPHDNRPTCWIFGAMGPDQRLYVYDYLLAGGPIAEIVQQVRVKRAMHGYAEPRQVVLDKKHSQKHNMALADGKSWESELEKAGIKRIELSDSNPGDVELGHKKVKEWLELRFSTLHNMELPNLMFFRKACGGTGGPIYQMKRYSYNDMGDKAEKNPSPKPKDLHKDFPDCIRYLVMKNPKYIDPEKVKAQNEFAKKRYEEFVGVRRRAYGLAA